CVLVESLFLFAEVPGSRGSRFIGCVLEKILVQRVGPEQIGWRNPASSLLRGRQPDLEVGSCLYHARIWTRAKGQERGGQPGHGRQASRGGVVAFRCPIPAVVRIENRSHLALDHEGCGHGGPWNPIACPGGCEETRFLFGN